MTTKLEELYSYYEELFKMSIAKNEHSILSCFHNVASPFVHNTFQFGVREIEPAIDKGDYQESGTGKGEKQKFSCLLLEKCEKNSQITNSFTTAGIIGTTSRDSKGKVIENKPLEKYHFLGVDEATAFLDKPNQFTMDLLNSLNRYYDDRMICKMLASGELKYKGNAVLYVGSYVDNTIRQTVLQKGFFQRSWINYKSYTKEEAKQIRKEMNPLAVSSPEKIARRKELIENIKKILQETEAFTGRKYSFGTSQAEDYSNKFENIIDSKEIELASLNPKLQSVFRTSLARAQGMGYKLIVHYCTINQLETVTIGAIEYALKCVDDHLTNFLDLLKEINAPCNGMQEIGKIELKKSDALVKILQIAEERKEFTRKEFHEKLKAQYGITLGEQGCDEILNKLVNEGRLKKKEGDKNSITYYL